MNGAKEPANNASKYAELPLWKNQRMMYGLKAGTTTTFRLSSSSHNFGVGTNFQNFPKTMRVFAVADKGHVLCSADYSQSDSYFVAFESQDKTMMATVKNDKDTHSEHVEFFFGYSYDSVVAGDKKKERWVVHPDEGVRQIIKKVTHGTNYDMGGDTMLDNVKKPAALAMIKALLGSEHSKKFIKFMQMMRADLMKDSALGFKQLARACEFAQSLYYVRYPQLKKWKKHSVMAALQSGGLIEMFGGSTTVMLCRPTENERFVPAAYGQGGTSGNINNAMLRLYFLCDDMWQAGFTMCLQVHDEIVFLSARR